MVHTQRPAYNNNFIKKAKSNGGSLPGKLQEDFCLAVSILGVKIAKIQEGGEIS